MQAVYSSLPWQKHFDNYLLTNRHIRNTSEHFKRTCEVCDNKEFFAKEDYERHIHGRKDRHRVLVAGNTD